MRGIPRFVVMLVLFTFMFALIEGFQRNRQYRAYWAARKPFVARLAVLKAEDDRLLPEFTNNAFSTAAGRMSLARSLRTVATNREVLLNDFKKVNVPERYKVFNDLYLGHLVFEVNDLKALAQPLDDSDFKRLDQFAKQEQDEITEYNAKIKAARAEW